MPDHAFEKYFCDRAELAETLYRGGWRNEAFLLATVALDALAAIWQHDLSTSNDSSALRMAAFVQKFSSDPKAHTIAAVFLGEDLLTHGPPRLASLADALLAARGVGRERVQDFGYRAGPLAHKDTDWAELVAQHPSIAEPELEKLAAHYTYPALLYRLHRCAVAHSLSSGTRTSCFSESEPDDEISYFPEFIVRGKVRPISLKIGLATVTRWVRACVSAYVAECIQADREPAQGYDPNAESLENLRRLFRKLK